MSRDYGENLNWLLSEVEEADKDQIFDGEIEILSEREDGSEGTTAIDVHELCGAALKRIQELEASSQWVSVEERLPEGFENVLTCDI